MKNCVIIHGCPSNSEDTSYDKHRLPWLKSKLIEKGVTTTTPKMPSPRKPKYEQFKLVFEKSIINDESILIGHSCGCAFLVRWLGEKQLKINKLILVAPWKINDEGDIFREDFYTYEVDKTINERVKEIIMFTSNNEDQLGKDSLQIFHEKIGGKIIELHEKGHYTKGDMGTEEFDELLKEVLA